MEILSTCRQLAKHPLMGTKRQDITPLPVRFWTVTKFPNYVIVYRPETVPANTHLFRLRAGTSASM
jgi:plasmid stabilization system protein ParE